MKMLEEKLKELRKENNKTINEELERITESLKKSNNAIVLCDEEAIVIGTRPDIKVALVSFMSAVMYRGLLSEQDFKRLLEVGEHANKYCKKDRNELINDLEKLIEDLKNE